MNLSPIQTPEDVPRLFDLIKPKNPSFAPAFYNSLRDTLVAADLDQANRLAYGSGSSRWRVVTLDGQLIDKSGTMSGGGTKVTKGLMGSNFVDDVNEQEFAKCEHEREKVEKKLKKVEEVKKSVKVEVEETEKEIPNVELELSKLEMDIKSLVQEVEETKSLIQKLRYVLNSHFPF
ncbi:SMCs flexible hinge [Paraphysoderma sedebokerense]|nr:SMCs flexible hinge [Paraphysoderma sedebokerense]